MSKIQQITLNNASKATDLANLGQEAQELATHILNFTNLLAKHKVYIKAFSDESKMRLSIMEISKIKDITAKFVSYYSACEDILSSHTTIPDNKSLIKHVLGHMKLSISDDFINQISDEDILEIYDQSGIQIFRNFKFYETTQYSLADLLIFEWYELYYRSSMITNRLMDKLAHVLSRSFPNRAIYEMNESPHFIKEIRAEPLQVCKITFKQATPTTDQSGHKAGFVLSCLAQGFSDNFDPTAIDFI